MHSYFRAVGFSGIRGKREMDRLIREVVTSCDEKIVVDEGDNRLFAELSRDFGYDTGITVCGAYDEMMNFRQSTVFRFSAVRESPAGRMWWWNATLKRNPLPEPAMMCGSA